MCLYTHAQEVSTWDTSSSAVDAVLRRASLTHWWRQWCKCTTVNQNNKQWKGLHSLGMIILYLRKSSLFFYWYQKIKKKKKSSGSRTGVACQHTVQGLGLSRQQLVINVVRCLLHFGFCGEKKKSFWSLEIWSRTSGTQVLSILRLNIQLISKSFKFSWKSANLILFFPVIKQNKTIYQWDYILLGSNKEGVALFPKKSLIRIRKTLLF